MKAENLQVSFAPGCERAELIIREVNKVNELEVKPPIKVNISGTISAPLEFLSKRKDEPDQIDQRRCYILINREDITITLITNESDEYRRGTVEGILEPHPSFVGFGVNSGKVWTPSGLGLYFKMNRSFFESKEDNMQLVTDLMNFTATVNNSIERSFKESGDRTDKFQQVVNSNLPKSFKLKVPIFKGTPQETIEVETFAQINGREVSFTLISPAAAQIVEELRDSAINTQIDAIREICPDIAVIEQ